MFKYEHDWELKAKVWTCKYCNAQVKPSAVQVKSNSFGKPSRKKVIGGLSCDERVAMLIHES